MPGAGAVFDAPLDGLHGIRVWLDRSAEATVLSLHSVQPDGSMGPELLRVPGSAGGGLDMTTYAFDALPDSAGHRYAFILTCPHCSPADEPRMLVADAHRGPGDFLQGGQMNFHRTAAFSLMYDPVPDAAASETQVTPSNPSPGSWRVQTRGGRPSIVTLAESYFPGWSVRVDGRPARLLQVDAAFMGVVVPAGEHTVTFRYSKPVTAGVGLAVTLATLVLAGVVLFRRERFARSRGERAQWLRLGAPGPGAGAAPGATARAAPPSPDGSSRDAGDAAHTV